MYHHHCIEWERRWAGDLGGVKKGKVARKARLELDGRIGGTETLVSKTHEVPHQYIEMYVNEVDASPG